MKRKKRRKEQKLRRADPRLTNPPGSGAVPGRWTEPAPGSGCREEGGCTDAQQCQGMRSPQVASSIAGKATEKKCSPLLFLCFFQPFISCLCH